MNIDVLTCQQKLNYYSELVSWVAKHSHEYCCPHNVIFDQELKIKHCKTTTKNAKNIMYVSMMIILSNHLILV